jgi:hypothetical protein
VPVQAIRAAEELYTTAASSAEHNCRCIDILSPEPIA